MSLLMTVFFENGFSEHFFPAVDNRKYPVAIDPYISGLDDEIEFNIEVWDGKWKICDDKRYSLMKNGNPVSSSELEPGCVFEGTVKKTDTWFSIKIDEAVRDRAGFTKYMIHRDKLSSLVIGSGNSCDIIFRNRFVSERNSEITFEGNETYINDNNSTNGTFLNGRIVNGKTPVRYGDVIYIVGLKIVYLGALIAINNPDGELRVNILKPVSIPEYNDDSEDDEYEKVYFLPTPRKLLPLDTSETSVERCAPKQEQKRQPLIFTIGPSFTMVIPIALAAMMNGDDGFGASSLVMSVGAAGISAMWAVINSGYNKKEARLSENTRREEYINYIAKLEDMLSKKTDHNRKVLTEQYPSVEEMLRMTSELKSRLWEKSSSHRDFLSVRLGMGDIASPFTVKTPAEDISVSHDPLNELGNDVKEKFCVLESVPVAVSLYDNRILGVVSSSAEKRYNLLRLISLQTASAHPYSEVRMCYFFRAREYGDMSFTRWLPHTYTPDGRLRMIACDSRSRGDVMYYLSDMIRERIGNSSGNTEGKTLPHYVIVISDISIIAGEPVSKYLLDPPKEAGITVVYAADSLGGLPAGCDMVIRDEAESSSCYSISSNAAICRNLVIDKIAAVSMDRFSRELADFELRDTSSDAEIPDMLSFLDMYRVSKIEDLDIYHKWLENRTYDTMKAMIGQKSGGKPVYLDIHEKYHGPHGLVAGTTGSGKSETLQSYILSMAVNYHPHEVAFILIDYKGGGMAQSFAGLPHLAGMITNLGGNGTTRALLSINAEIRRRQRIFNEYKIKHIDSYIELYRNGEADEPMPHLIIIADEFAELKKEQPEFVKALVSAARVGRSLGINLILATQKPSGVVDDEIWSNTRFRICLRVADRQDSNEMLKRPDAAFVTGTGRGFIQVGNDEIFDEFQSGWSGAQYTPDVPFDDGSKASVQMIGITGKPESGAKKKKRTGDNLNKRTQLDEIVKYTEKLSAEKNIEPLRQIWLQPLPDMLYLEDLDVSAHDREHMLIPVGLADDPENQRQFAVSLDFIHDGHLLICGGSGSGKSTLIQTIIYSAAMNYSPGQINFYIADFSGRTMNVFSDLPHTGAVCLEGEDEKIGSVMTFIREELERRKNILSEKGIGSYRDYIVSFSDLPMILLAVDNYAAFSECYEQYEDLFIQLSREAAGYGIYMIVSCSSSSDMRGRIRQGFTKGIGMQLPDKYEYDSVIGMRTEIMPDDRVSGRGLIRCGTPLEFQTALAVRNSDGNSMMMTIRNMIREKYGDTKSSARKITDRFEAFDADEFIGETALAENEYLLGRDCDSGEYVKTDLDKIFCYCVSGGGESGKTNFLKFTAKQMKKKNARVYIVDSILRELEGFAEDIGADGYITGAEELYHFMEDVLVPELTERNGLVYDARQEKRSVSMALEGLDRIVLIINSTAEFMEAVYNNEFDMSEFMEIVLEKGAEHKLHFVTAFTPREYNECWQYKAMRMAAEMKSGIHLGGEPAEQGIFDFDIPENAADRKTPAGSALTVSDGKTVSLMTPEVKETE